MSRITTNSTAYHTALQPDLESETESISSSQLFAPGSFNPTKSKDDAKSDSDSQESFHTTDSKRPKSSVSKTRVSSKKVLDKINEQDSKVSSLEEKLNKILKEYDKKIDVFNDTLNRHTNEIKDATAYKSLTSNIAQIAAQSLIIIIIATVINIYLVNKNILKSNANLPDIKFQHKQNNKST